VQIGLQISMQNQAKKYQKHWYTDKKAIQNAMQIVPQITLQFVNFSLSPERVGLKK
jgi:formaldehyde-activating enzyme involved in methanogenesis